VVAERPYSVRCSRFTPSPLVRLPGVAAPLHSLVPPSPGHRSYVAVGNREVVAYCP
jgi:hypothetical protein